MIAILKFRTSMRKTASIFQIVFQTANRLTKTNAAFVAEGDSLMKVWKLESPKKMSLEESAPTALASGLVKVKIEEVLFSTTDLDVYNGVAKRPYPFVMGRNAVGVISEVFAKEKTLFKKMDRVAIEPYVVCNRCEECLQQDFQRCSELQYMGQNSEGLLKNFVDVSINQVHRLPDNLSNEKALFVSYVAFCLNIVNALHLKKGGHVVIFASTKTGIILAQLVAYYQAVPILVSNNEDLLESARELGIYYCLNSKEVDVEREILTTTGGRLCRKVVLFSDSEFSVKDVYHAASINADICLAGMSNKDSKLSLAQISQKHLNIFGVYNGVGSFSSAINLLVTGTVQVEKLIGSTISFNALDKELAKIKTSDLALKSKIIKVD